MYIGMRGIHLDAPTVRKARFVRGFHLICPLSASCPCRYDPPFTLGPFRRNEVWVNLHLTEEQVASKLATSTK
jgi:hypothetical protein